MLTVAEQARARNGGHGGEAPIEARRAEGAPRRGSSRSPSTASSAASESAPREGAHAAPLSCEAATASSTSAPLGLVQRATTEQPAESLGNLAALDAALAAWRRERAREHSARAGAAAWEGRARTAAWHRARARALAEPWHERAARCGSEWVAENRCDGCGHAEARPVRCGLRHWCASCAAHRARREYARMMRVLAEHVRAERSRWHRAGRPRHQAPQLRLLTLTVAHHGESVAEQRAAIERAWPRFRREVHRLAGGHAPPYAATWEVGIEEAAEGHCHLHVLIIAPWMPLHALASAWVRATHGLAEAQGLDLRTVRRPSEAAAYLAAYVAGSTAAMELPVPVAAAWVRATHGRRLITASRGFWLAATAAYVPACSCCGAVGLLVRRILRACSVRTMERANPPTAPT